MHMLPRHQQIVDYLQRHENVPVEALAARLAVTPQTVRRDLRVLEQEGHVARLRGVAALPRAARRDAASPRATGSHEAERRLGAVAAGCVEPGSSLMLGSGPVAEAVAAALAHRTQLQVVTNSLRVAAVLSDSPLDRDANGDGSRNGNGSDSGIEVIVSGGVVRRKDSAMLDSPAVEFLRYFKADIAIIGVAGVTHDGNLLADDAVSARMLRSIVEQARTVWLVADHTRFQGVGGVAQVSHIGRMSKLFTDAALPSSVAAALGDCGVEILAPLAV